MHIPYDVHLLYRTRHTFVHNLLLYRLYMLYILYILYMLNDLYDLYILYILYRTYILLH